MKRKLKATYTVTELAAMAGMHRDSMRRLVVRCGIEPLKNGRKWVIPISEVVEKLGVVITSFNFVESLENDGR